MQPCGPSAAHLLLLLFSVRIGFADIVFTAEACNRGTFGLRGIQGDSTRYKQCGPSGKVWIVPCAPQMSFDPIEKVCKEIEEPLSFRRMEKFQGRSRRPIITTPATQPAEEFVFSTHRPKRPRIKGKGKKKLTTTTTPISTQNFITEVFPEEPLQTKQAAIPAFPPPGTAAATTIRPEYTVKYNGENMTEEELLRRLVDLVSAQKATAAKEKADKEDKERRRLEEEERRREEEARQRQEEEEERRRQEEAQIEQKRQEEERRKQEEAVRLEKKRQEEERRKIWEEKKQKKEEERRLAVERAEEARRQAEEEEQRKRAEEEEWKRRQVEEAERLRRLEEEEELARRRKEEEIRQTIERAKAEQERLEQLRRIEEAKREQERLEKLRKEERERKEKEKEEIMRRERERAERMKQEMERQLQLERAEMERQMVFNRMTTTTTASPDFEIIRFPPTARVVQGSVIPPLPTLSTTEGPWITAENVWKPPVDLVFASRENKLKTTPVPRVLEGCIPNGDCPFSYESDHFCAHPDNPTMYLQCAPMIGRRGRWTVRHCPEGLLFSNHLGRCEKDPYSAYNPNQRVVIPRLPEESKQVTWQGNREIVTVTPVYTRQNGIHNTIDSFPKDLLPVVVPIHPGDLFKPKQIISEFDDYEELDLSKIHPLFPRVQPSFINNFLPFQPLQEGEKSKDEDNILGAVFKPFFKKVALKQTKNFLDRMLSDEEIRRLEMEADRLRGEGTSHN